MGWDKRAFNDERRQFTQTTGSEGSCVEEEKRRRRRDDKEREGEDSEEA